MSEEDGDDCGTAAAMRGGETWLGRFVRDETFYRGMGSIFNLTIASLL